VAGGGTLCEARHETIATAAKARSTTAAAAIQSALEGDGKRIPSAPCFSPSPDAPRLDAAANESR
jgi:hypothetical protein